MRFTLDI